MVANEKYNSIDIEEGLLGLILISKSSQEKALIDLKIEDFTTISNQIIMKNVASLFNDGLSISLVTLKDSLKKNNELTKIGGDKFLDKLLLKNVSKMHVNDYLRIIKENAKIRKVKNVLMNAVKYIDTTDIKDVEEIVHNVESDILLATRDAQKIEQRSFEEILTTVVEKIDANKKNEGVTGIETGFSQLDNLTSGFHDGDFIILAARPSMGKTALALSMATNVAKQSPVYMFSLEMPSEQLAQRMISTIAHVDGGKLRKPKFLTPMD
jgi:replicative DNA helicase